MQFLVTLGEALKTGLLPGEALFLALHQEEGPEKWSRNAAMVDGALPKD